MLGFIIKIKLKRNGIFKITMMFYLILQFLGPQKFLGLHFTEGVKRPKGFPLVKSTSGDPGSSWLMRLLADPQSDQEQMYYVYTFSKRLLTLEVLVAQKHFFIYFIFFNCFFAEIDCGLILYMNLHAVCIWGACQGRSGSGGSIPRWSGWTKKTCLDFCVCKVLNSWILCTRQQNTKFARPEKITTIQKSRGWISVCQKHHII